MSDPTHIGVQEGQRLYDTMQDEIDAGIRCRGCYELDDFCTCHDEDEWDEFWGSSIDD